MVLGPLLLQLPGETLELGERFAQRSRGLGELRLPEFTIGAGYGVEPFDGLSGGVFVGLPGLLAALGNRGAGDVLEIEVGLPAPGALPGPQTGDVGGGAEG